MTPHINSRAQAAQTVQIKEKLVSIFLKWYSCHKLRKLEGFLLRLISNIGLCKYPSTIEVSCQAGVFEFATGIGPFFQK